MMIDAMPDNPLPTGPLVVNVIYLHLQTVMPVEPTILFSLRLQLSWLQRDIMGGAQASQPSSYLRFKASALSANTSFAAGCVLS